MKGGGDCSERVALLPEAPVRPVDYNSTNLHWKRITTESELDDALAIIRENQVIALDIETTGSTNPWNGSIRLIQVGVEHPLPQQFLIDCWAVNPQKLMPILSDKDTTVLTCNGAYEQNHILYRYGTRINNMYDVFLASKALGRSQIKQSKNRLENQVNTIKDRFDTDIALLDERVEECDDLDLKRSLKEQLRIAKAAKRDAVKNTKDRATKPKAPGSSMRLLMRRYVGKKISKSQQTSAWHSEHLSYQQERYAAMDVAGLLDIYPQIDRDVKQRGLSKDVQKSCETLYPRTRDSHALRAELNSGKSARILRGMQHSRTREELDTIYAMRNRIALPAVALKGIEKVYAKRTSMVM